mmetsp:Transcript_22094/g.51908  ORF Transcript_22094/g.51908 Transcript_22094/m.51908 type:complete len:256 (-) Transcript_22094:3846-4613(-)
MAAIITPTPSERLFSSVARGAEPPASNPVSKTCNSDALVPCSSRTTTLKPRPGVISTCTPSMKNSARLPSRAPALFTAKSTQSFVPAELELVTVLLVVETLGAALLAGASVVVVVLANGEGNTDSTTAREYPLENSRVKSETFGARSGACQSEAKATTSVKSRSSSTGGMSKRREAFPPASELLLSRCCICWASFARPCNAPASSASAVRTSARMTSAPEDEHVEFRIVRMPQISVAAACKAPVQFRSSNSALTM